MITMNFFFHWRFSMWAPTMMHFTWNRINPVILGSIYTQTPGKVKGEQWLINGEGLAGCIVQIPLAAFLCWKLPWKHLWTPKKPEIWSIGRFRGRNPVPFFYFHEVFEENSPNNSKLLRTTVLRLAPLHRPRNPWSATVKVCFVKQFQFCELIFL